MERGFFHSVDMKIHYQTEGEGPVLICLHGGKGNSGDYFFPFLSPLAQEMKMIYLDERGSGRSKPVPDKRLVSFEGMAQDIDNLIKHLGVEKAGLLGHSFGCNLALYYTLHYPKQVRELYLIAGGVTYPEISKNWWPGFYKTQMKDMELDNRVQEVYDRYNAGKISADESFRTVIKLQIPAIFYHWPKRRDIILETLARTDFTSIGKENSNFQNAEDIIQEIRKRLDEITCPVLLLPGQHDIATPLENMGAMARSIRDCEVKVIPRSRHFPFIDEPELVCKAIREFRQNRRII